MFNRFPDEIRRITDAAVEEARRRSDHRVTTEHLLLGLLSVPGVLPSGTFDVDVEAARSAVATLDRRALLSIGVDPDGLPNRVPPRAGAHPSFTPGAKKVMDRTLKEAFRSRAPMAEPRHVMLSLLACGPRDPVSELFSALDVDQGVLRERLLEAG